jgi:hypothetical protein
MPERAEIEAVLGLAVCATCKQADNVYCSSPFHQLADRVRDARDDNNGRCRTCGDWVGPDDCERCARSPQGEDHEAGIEAAEASVKRSKAYKLGPRSLAEHAVAAYLSRVSPSRDGTVAVDQPEPDALGGLSPSQPKEDDERRH